MAELTDITFQIASDVAAAVVPLVGTDYTVTSAIDAQTYGATRAVPPTTIFPGRPLLADLTNRMELGKCSISVETDKFDAPAKQYTNKTEQLVSANPLTLGFAQSEYSVQLSGAITAGNVIGLQVGNSATSYKVKATDTLASVAAGLAAAAPGDGFLAVTAFGPNVTVNAPAGSPPLIVTVGTTSTYIRPVQYRKRAFDAIIWATNPYDRQYLGRVLEGVYDLGQSLTMPDGTVARVMECQGSIDYDQETPEGVFIRRVRWIIDFITAKVFTKTTIVSAIATMTPVLPGGTLADFTSPTALQL